MTSSSLEVLAGLSLTDEEYTESMMFKDGKPSAFCRSIPPSEIARLTYQTTATSRIFSRRYARTPLQNTLGKSSLRQSPSHVLTCSITKEYHRNKSAKPRTIISDELSSTLNQLQHDLEVSDLYENMSSRKNVLSRALPRTLIDKIGLDVLMQRLPEQVSIPNSHRVQH